MTTDDGRDEVGELLFGSHPDPVAVVGPDGRYARVNPAAAAVLGRRPEDLIGRRPEDFADPIRAAVTHDNVARALAGESLAFESRYLRPDGTGIVLAGRTFPIVVDGAPGGFLCVSRDVGEQRDLELAIGAHAERLRSLVRLAAPDGPDGGRRMTAALRLGSEHLGLAVAFAATLAGTAVDLAQMTADDTPLDAGLLARVALLPRDEILVVERERLAYVLLPIDVEGTRWGVLGFTGDAPPPRLGPADRELVRLIGALVAAAIARERAAERIQALALTDAVTGLPNRALLLERFERALAARRRHRGAVALHLLAFETEPVLAEPVVRGLAARLRRAVRELDTLARVEPGLFAVLQPDATAEGCDALAARLLATAADPVVVEGGIARPRVRAAVALAPDDGDEAASLLALGLERCRDEAARRRSG